MTLKGNAALGVTVSSQQHWHLLAFPLTLRLAPAHGTTRFARRSLDRSAREVISVGAGRPEFEAMLRFDRNAQSLIDVLSYAADGNVITYYPDTSGPGYQLWLINADQVVQLMQDADRFGFGEYQIPVRFQDASASGQSLEALASPWLWRHSAGSLSRQATFTRPGSVGGYRDIDRVLKQAAANTLRTTWRSVGGVWRPLTLLEVPRTNELVRSEALDNASWAKVGLAGTPVVADQAVGPDGATSLDELVEDTNNSAHAVTQTATLTADAIYALSCWAIAGTRSWLRLAVTADAGANRADSWFDLANGVVGTGTDAGAGAFVGSYVEDWTDVAPGLYRCVLVGSCGNGATSIATVVALASGDGVSGYTGDGSSLYAGYAQLEDNAREASSYIPTTTAADSRGAEAFSDAFPWTPRQLAEMGGATFYLDFIEGMVPNWVTEGGVTTRLLTAGESDNSAPRLLIYRQSATNDYHFNAGNNVDPERTSTLDLTPSRGDRIQLAGQFNADGSVRILGRKNGATDASGSLTSPAAPASAWSDDLIWLGGVGTSGRGIQEYADAVVFGGLLDIDQCEAKLA